ncbi:hypothetical protein FDO65_12930 [Nakamurella flava]|uniref:dTMP kinase n=1 Tax=Nakamurella flava TaxID=2576308 RepID=A0A4U6QEP1_9ACTN|nr:MFS transporter [Nakamurella flava]TKV58462.1 hypothetical protein FDO65_12930 [Nakamurella flava]
MISPVGDESGRRGRRGRAPGDNSLAVLLRIPIFRRMWAAIALSSLGDWLALLATTALAAYLTRDTSNLAQGAAVSGVLLVRLLPDLLLGAVAGALVDKVDRRKVAVACDTLAGLLYASIVIFPSLWWLLAAQFIAEAIGLFSTPAKQTLWVNIVPRERLAVANQLNSVSIYGMIPVASVIFVLLSTLASFFGTPTIEDTGSALISGGTNTLAIDIALGLNAVSYWISAGVVFTSRRMIPAFVGERNTSDNILSLIAEGIRFVRHSRLMRSVYIGILGAFGAGGLIVGVAQAYVATLGAGNSGYAILFGSVFTGVALGMLVGPKVLPTVPRRMIFTPAIGGAGAALIVMSVLQDFLGAVITATVMGLFGGIAWITGFTMIGQEVSDQLRGRVFAFVMSSVRITLLGSIAVGPVLAGAVGSHLISVGDFRFVVTGPGIVLAVGGLLAVGVSAIAGQQIGGLTAQVRRKLFRRGTKLWENPDQHPGVLLAVEGPDPDVVHRYAMAVTAALRADGVDAVRVSSTTPPAPPGPAGYLEDHPADALRAMADLADLTADRIVPALDESSVVVCEGFIDAAVVRYRTLGVDEQELGRIAQWAVAGLRADLSLVVEPADPRARAAADAPDEPERVPAASSPDAGHHDLVDAEQAYRDRASYAPERYLLVTAPSGDGEQLTQEVRLRLESVLRQRGLLRPGALLDPSATAAGAGPVTSGL